MKNKKISLIFLIIYLSLSAGEQVIDKTSIKLASQKKQSQFNIHEETEWVHHKWEKSGRTFYNPNTCQYMYTSYIGQSNVELGEMNYAPYIWDSRNKIARYADCELRFFDSHFEFWRSGEELTKSKFKLYKKAGKYWENIALSFDVITFKEGDEYGTVTLKLTDENKNEIIANIRFGLFHYIILDFEVKVNTEDEYRLEMENSGLLGDPVEIHSGSGIKGLAEKEDRIIGVTYEKMYFRWTYDEAGDRLYLYEVQVDGSKTSKIIVELGHLSPGKSLFISPDQWGPVGIQVNTDDGEEDGRLLGTDRWQVDGWYDDGALFLGYHTDYSPAPYEPAWRWDNITASGIANDGCKIEIWHNDYHTEGGPDTVDVPLYGIDEADPTQFSDVAGNRPSDRTKTTASVVWPSVREITHGTHEKAASPEIKTIIQGLLDSYTYTGTQAMAFTWFVTYTLENWWRDYDDYSQVGGTPARLTIVYTTTPPNTPNLIRIFDNAIFNSPTYQCTVSVTSVDPEGDDIQYEIQWDIDPYFSNPSSLTTGIHSSGDTVTTAILLGLTPVEAETLFYWRAHARDPGGSTLWSSWSEVRSFTMDMEAEDVYWYQVAKTQFNQCTTHYVTVQGDSVILDAGQTEGNLTSPPVVYNDLTTENHNRNDWDGVKWTKSAADDSIGVQIEYKHNGPWTLVPDDSIGAQGGDNNSTGFFDQTSDFCTVDLSLLRPNIYDTLRIKAIFRRSPAKASIDPALLMWALGNKDNIVTGVSLADKPMAFALMKNQPNPFTYRTEIQYQLPKRVNVELKVYDLMGRSVAILIKGVQKAGYYSIQWEGTNKNGEHLPSGVYFLRLKTGEYLASQKMLLLR